MRKMFLLLIFLLMLAPSAHAAEIYWASDVHYYAKGLCADEKILETMEMKGDGRSVRQVAAITGAFFAEVLRNKPDALILSGDLTYNGELEGHKELRDMLEPIRQAGIKVLIIPGNHDINTGGAYGYPNSVATKAEETTWADFHAIYDDLAYGDALLTAPESYSYLVPVASDLWLLMLDGVITEPLAQTGGYITSATRGFIEESLALAKERGAKVVTVTHHNFLQHSPSFYEGYVFDHNEKGLAVVKDGGVKLNLAGHMHIQHILQEDGFTEMLLSALPMTPCQYGIITYEKGQIDIRTEVLSAFTHTEAARYIEKMAARYLLRLSISSIPENEQAILANYGARINERYFAGQVTSAFFEEPAYEMWEKYAADVSTLARYVIMMQGMDVDMTRLSITP
jgi:Predicted phosphohydrolases